MFPYRCEFSHLQEGRMVLSPMFFWLINQEWNLETTTEGYVYILITDYNLIIFITFSVEWLMSLKLILS
jgi:hypothetical protein